MPFERRTPTLMHCAVWPQVLALATLGGCYDAEALKRQAHSALLTATLAEVDLGIFATTLPRDPVTEQFITVNIHIFGTVTRSQLSAVEQQLKADNFKLRQDTLAAVRQSTREELTDPELTKLRTRIHAVVNKLLTDAPVKEVGFHQVTVR